MSARAVSHGPAGGREDIHLPAPFELTLDTVDFPLD